MAEALRFGVAGLGRAARIILPWFKKAPGAELAAVADTRPEALEPFASRGLKTFLSVEEMCASDAVDAICICTPNRTHAKIAILAAENGKHIIGEKPMAITLDDATAMIEAIQRNKVKFVTRSKLFEPPIRKMREIISSGKLGRPYHINTFNYRGWLVNWSFLAEELDTDQGGGLVYRQGPHQAEILRYLGGGMVKSVRAMTGRWGVAFDSDTEGNYAAFLQFENGTSALVSNHGYGFFDVAELTWGIGEAGPRQPVDQLYEPRLRQTRPVDPDEKYSDPSYALAAELDRERPHPGHQPFCGLTIVSCERGDIRQSENGVYVHTAEGRSEVPCDVGVLPANEVIELTQAVAQGRPTFPDERWGRATLELILAIRQSSAEGREVELHHQVPSAY